MIMEFLFGLYIIAILSVFFVGFMAVKSTVNKDMNNVDKIASLQHWEYLRSLDKDGYK